MNSHGTDTKKNNYQQSMEDLFESEEDSEDSTEEDPGEEDFENHDLEDEAHEGSSFEDTSLEDIFSEKDSPSEEVSEEVSQESPEENKSPENSSQSSGEEIVQLNVRIPQTLHQRLKVESVRQRASMKKLVIEALRKQLVEEISDESP
jgi:predicted HicB family RNase H-like nuclease